VARTRLRVTGTVQGVGFRPFVYRHAVDLGLSGYVLNDSRGVLIEVEGDTASIAELARRLVAEPPPLARVTTVAREDDGTRTEPLDTGFRIVESDGDGPPDVPVSIDTAVCGECLAEMSDPADRRFRYPFTNCTSCGPRYTIVRSVPYDRPATTMAGFPMCADCLREYHDPTDRRFHAQPNACPVCGPQLAWRLPSGELWHDGPAAIAAAVAALRAGQVVAVKGIGGYHLAVDATDAAAVGRLRRRKARDDKPFAVMVPDVAAAQALCELDTAALSALTSPRRPIVLAPCAAVARAGVAAGVAPDLPEIGLMLPYSPLHHLLLADCGVPLVMTSGNRSDEPIAHDDDDAVARLGPLVDGLLTHDRPIHIRCDDSVVRAGERRLQLLRRSRGYAPEPMPLPFPAERAVLAVGAELKSTIAVTKGESVVASHHIGDLEHLATYRSFLQAVEHVPALYGVRPEVVAHDLHPEYLSTKWAEEQDAPTVAVQHHHAHVASCMVEHLRTEPVVGVAFDGLGYGPDGTLWGGEVLVADLGRVERVAHLRAVPMPGGVAAIREPWRMGAVWAELAGGPAFAVDALPSVARPPLDAVLRIARAGRNPVTTSAGRLFDAVAALLGLRDTVTFEAQAAIALEALARTVTRSDAPTYPGTVVARLGDDGQTVLDPTSLVAAVVRDHLDGVPVPVLAAGFHEAIGRAAAALARDVAEARGIDAVVITGGVFQNARLSEIVEDDLRRAGLTVLAHGAIPPNDGGISIGQAAIAAWRTST
jgi:hydrogenase maturation protein HypF